MTRAILLLCACAGALFSTLSSISAEPSEKEKADLAGKVYTLLKDKCYSCHGDPNGRVMGKIDGTPFNFVLDYDKLVSNRLLAPKDEESELYTVMKSGGMPREVGNPRKRVKLPQDDLDLVLNWIKAGAPKWNPDGQAQSGPKVAWSELKLKGPGARANSVMSEGPNNTVVLFGGHDGDTLFTDTWVFADGKWTEPKTATKPDSSILGAMAFDRKRKVNVVLTEDGKTWEWDGKSWAQAAPEKSPPPRHSCSLAYDASREVIVLFGGATKENVLLADMWSYDGKTWKALEAKGPDARKRAAMAWSPASKALVLYGGEAQAGAQNDTWLFDGKAWNKASATVSPSGPGRMASSTSSAVLVTEGDAVDTWLWNGKDWVKGPSGPGKRQGFGLAYNPKSRGVLLFGGRSESSLSDLWELNAAK